MTSDYTPRPEHHFTLWEFARGSMRTNLIAKNTVEHFNADAARDLAERSFDLDAMRVRGHAYERLDQMAMEVLLGVR